MSDIHPTLVHVSAARSYGLSGDYDLCLQCYADAKREAEREFAACRNAHENSRWNSLIKDIVQEEAAIRRLKGTIHEIEHLMNVDDQRRIGQLDLDRLGHSRNDGDDVVMAPMKRRLRLLERRERPDRQKRFSAPPREKKGRGKSEEAPQMRPARKKTKESQNPLVQQIIDMGILIKEPNVQWESIAGLGSVKRLLRQNLVILPMRPDICHGLLAPWRSVLFYGPPGTGKTFLAKAVATECKRTFFNITSATITSRFHGESEKLVGYLFDLAEEMSPSTLFFDEIDSVASQRGKQGENEASRRMKAQLLTRMEGIDSTDEKSGVFVMAATNFPWDLDEALLRRFQKRVYIPLPDAEGREAILKMHIGEMMAPDFDVAKFVGKLDGYSCADIANLCRDVAQSVFDRQTKDLNTQEWLDMPAEEANLVISNEDFEGGMKRRKSSVDKASVRKYEEWRQLKGAE